MRELVGAMIKEKPFIALTDAETNHGGLSLNEIHTQCLEADVLAKSWNFLGLEKATSGANYQEAYLWPGGQEIYDALFALEPVEWNRIGHFQDVTMRQIAERLLPDAAGTTYVDNEIVKQKLKPLPPSSKAFHVYSSALNPGAAQLMDEVARARSFTLHLDGEATEETANALHMTTEAANLAKSDHMLLYLTSQTWTRPIESAQLAAELMEAIDFGVNVLLVHEMPGAGGQEARFGCEFASFFSCADGATPPELLNRGIYSSVAVPLKGGAWREASMMLLGMALGMSKEALEDAKAGRDVLGLGEHHSKRFASSLRLTSTRLRKASTDLASSARKVSRKASDRLSIWTSERSGLTSTTDIAVVSVVSAAEPLSGA